MKQLAAGALAVASNLARLRSEDLYVLMQVRPEIAGEGTRRGDADALAASCAMSSTRTASWGALRGSAPRGSLVNEAMRPELPQMVRIHNDQDVEKNEPVCVNL